VHADQDLLVGQRAGDIGR